MQFLDYNRNAMKKETGAIPPDGAFGKRLRSIREERNLSVSRVAQISGITQGYIAQIEGGVRPSPGLAILTALARALRVSLDELTGFDLAASSQSDGASEQRLQTLEAGQQRLEKGLLDVNKEVHALGKGVIDRLDELKQSLPKTQSRRKTGAPKK